MRRSFFAPCALLLAALFVIGCGSTRTVTGSSPPITYIPPASSITPEGAKPLPPTVSLAPMLTNSQLVTPAVLTLIEAEEGYDRCAYFDPFGRVYTAGFGQTHGIYAGFCFASRAAAVENLKASVEREYLPAVVAVVGRNAPPGVYTGELSFAYNLGAGIFTGQLRVDLERHDYVAACAIQRGYDHAGGVVLADLARRRVRECNEILRKPPPRETPAQHRARVHRERVARLDSDYRARRGLNSVLGRYACLHGYRGFNRDRRRKCTVWRARHGQVSRDIQRLHGLGIW